MRVIISAGGTGGHIYPALAIIDKIKQQEPDSEFLYIGTHNRMEKDIVPNRGIPFKSIEMYGLNKKNPLKNFKTIKCIFKSFKECKKIIKEFNPDIVIGVGGYITAPVIIAAHKLKCKIIIHEQNSIPGVSNKLISKYANRICISLPNTKKYFDSNKVVYTGNPRSEEIISVKPADKKDYGLSNEKKLVVIVMGSLGSTTMTKKIKAIIPAFNMKDYQVIIVTGKEYYESYKTLNCPKNVALVPYLDNFINLLKSTDLIISRAGASVIAEITAIGLPSVLVPSPYVTNNHQYINAKELEDMGACKLITEEAFSIKTLLPAIDNIINDNTNYDKMRQCSKKLGVPNSATKFYEEIKKVIKEDK